MVSSLFPPIGIVCHDAGGANQILAMCDHGVLACTQAYVEGPARSLWDRRFPGHRTATSLSELLVETRTLITGTGWASSLEHEARAAARQLGIRSIAVLDHWTNYGSRFSRDGNTILPDEIWVVDRYAERLARLEFPGLPISLHEDCYAIEAVAQVAPISAATPDELLYLLEPVRSDWGKGEPGEFQALRYFISCLPRLGLPKGTIIRLRPHPSEQEGKYAHFLGDGGGFWLEMASGTLSDALSRCRWVAGCQTYAMTLALKAGRRVYGTLPPWAPPCVLPHDGIVHLRNGSDL